jgi:hypothetical protein
VAAPASSTRGLSTNQPRAGPAAAAWAGARRAHVADLCRQRISVGRVYKAVAKEMRVRFCFIINYGAATRGCNTPPSNRLLFLHPLTRRTIQATQEAKV